MTRSETLPEFSCFINTVDGFIDFLQHQMLILCFWILNELNSFGQLLIWDFTFICYCNNLIVRNLCCGESLFYIILQEKRSLWGYNNFIILFANSNDVISTILNKIDNLRIGFLHNWNLISTQKFLLDYILKCFFESASIIEFLADQICDELRISQIIDVLACSVFCFVNGKGCFKVWVIGDVSIVEKSYSVSVIKVWMSILLWNRVQIINYLIFIIFSNLAISRMTHSNVTLNTGKGVYKGFIEFIKAIIFFFKDVCLFKISVIKCWIFLIFRWFFTVIFTFFLIFIFHRWFCFSFKNFSNWIELSYG